MNAIPWYKSPQQIGLVTTFVSAAIAMFPKIGQALGLSSATDVSNAVSNFFGVVAFVAPAIASIFRAKSKIQPLTLTQAAADAHPATLANQVAPAPPPLPSTSNTGSKP